MAGDSLFSQLCQPDHLRAAWRQVRGKNSRGGIDGNDPEDLEAKIETLIRETVSKLESGRYVPEPYREFMIPKLNDKREWRTLALPAVIDKVVQQAVVNLIEPLFEKNFLDCSYAYRRGKGPVKACRRVSHILNNSRPGWAAAADIDDFFSSLPHQKLLDRLTTALDDKPLVELMALWLRAGYINQRGDFSDPKKGIAQGAVISPLLANFYLNSLDQLTVDKKIPYVRYSDNYIVFAKTEAEIGEYRRLLADFLKQSLGLELNVEKSPEVKIDRGFSFLGIFFGPDGLSISREKERKIGRRLNQLTDPKTNPEPLKTRSRINEKISGHQRFYGYIKPVEAFARFDEILLQRLEKLLAAYRKTGALNSRNELKDYCQGFHFYLERPAGEQQTRIRNLLDKVFKPEPVSSKSKNGPDSGGRRHRTQARQSHYVKEIAAENEVVVSTPGTFIGKSGNRLILRRERKIVYEQPFSRLRTISITGRGISLSSDLVSYCSGKNIPITFFHYTGRACASIRSPLFCSGDLSLRQVRMHVNGKGLVLARRILIAKCRSQMNLLKYYNRHRSQTDPVFNEKVVTVLEGMKRDLKTLQEIDIKPPLKKVRTDVFTAEARVGSGYWEVIKILLPAEVGFKKRVKRGAQDVVNVMLNYGYGILYHRVWEAVTNASLNPEVGFLHAWQSGRPSLVYDLVEEYRQSFVDRPLFSLLTKGTTYKTLKLKSGSNLLEKETRELVLRTVLDRLATLINFRNEKIKADTIITRQISDFAAVIAETKKTYRPYVMSY